MSDTKINGSTGDKPNHKGRPVTKAPKAIMGPSPLLTMAEINNNRRHGPYGSP